MKKRIWMTLLLVLTLAGGALAQTCQISAGRGGNYTTPVAVELGTGGSNEYIMTGNGAKLAGGKLGEGYSFNAAVASLSTGQLFDTVAEILSYSGSGSVGVYEDTGTSRDVLPFTIYRGGQLYAGVLEQSGDHVTNEIDYAIVSNISLPIFVRLNRTYNGTNYINTWYYSGDGANWTQMFSGAGNGRSGFTGLILNSGGDGYDATAVFSNVSINASFPSLTDKQYTGPTAPLPQDGKIISSGNPTGTIYQDDITNPQNNAVPETYTPFVSPGYSCSPAEQAGLQAQVSVTDGFGSTGPAGGCTPTYLAQFCWGYEGPYTVTGPLIACPVGNTCTPTGNVVWSNSATGQNWYENVYVQVEFYYNGSLVASTGNVTQFVTVWPHVP